MSDPIIAPDWDVEIETRNWVVELEDGATFAVQTPQITEFTLTFGPPSLKAGEATIRDFDPGDLAAIFNSA